MKKNRGQTILEVLIATVIVSVLLVALMALLTNSLKSSGYSRSLNQATEYSNQAADWLRNHKSQDGWAVFSETLQEDNPTSVTYCLNSLPSTSIELRNLANSACAINDFISGTTFWREADFDLSNINSGIIEITVTTYWQDKQEFKAPVTLRLNQWN